VQLSFEVGQSERHRVDFAFDKFWGRLTIAVDGNSVVDQVRLFSVSLVKSYEFTVGDLEKHAVRIDKHRMAYLAGFRPQPVKACVDGQLVAEGVA
jgi:hypothetical protein